MAGVIFASCSQSDAPPKGLLSKGDMVKTITEIYLAEQRLSSMGLKRDSLRQIFTVIEPRVFAKTGTNDSTFKTSLDYYLKRPKDIEVIYTAIIDSLNLHEQRMISNEVKK